MAASVLFFQVPTSPRGGLNVASFWYSTSSILFSASLLSPSRTLKTGAPFSLWVRSMISLMGSLPEGGGSFFLPCCAVAAPPLRRRSAARIPAPCFMPKIRRQSRLRWTGRPAEAVQAERPDGVPGLPVRDQVGHDLPDHGCELEAVARAGRRDH